MKGKYYPRSFYYSVTNIGTWFFTTGAYNNTFKGKQKQMKLQAKRKN
jgi:hypothetical protein